MEDGHHEKGQRCGEGVTIKIEEGWERRMKKKKEYLGRMTRIRQGGADGHVEKNQHLSIVRVTP